MTEKERLAKEVQEFIDEREGPLRGGLSVGEASTLADDILALLLRERAQAFSDAAAKICTVHTAHHTRQYCDGYLAACADWREYLEAKARGEGGE